MKLFTKIENQSDDYLRAYDDFVQQSVEIGSYLSYKSKKQTNKPDDDNKLVLIKYKSDAESGVNSLRANQLQKRREIHSLLLFIFFLFVTIITLSQILVMHSSTNNSSFHQIKLMQEELKLMDLSIDKMLKENHVIPMQIWIALKQYNDNIKTFSNYMNSFNDSILFTFEHSNQTHSLPCDFNTSLLLKNFNETNINKTLDHINNFLINNSNNKTNSKCLEYLILNIFSDLNQKYSDLFEKNSILFSKLNKLHLINETIEYFSNKSSLLGNYLPIRQDMNKLVNKYKHNKYKFNTNVSLCEPQPPNLYGRLKIEERKANKSLIDKMEKENPEVKFGGFWSPKNCQARHKIAIIIPYRDREDHLFTLLSYLHPILQRQQLDYKIYVTEQAGNGTFNKAIVMNAAFIYAFNEDNYNCYCFHDVDLVPEDDRNMYSCGKYPKHMSIGVDEMNYQLQYEELIGGVLILGTEHIIASNGYSNLYWGWGAEDDDLYYRFKGLGYKIERPPLKIGRYTMMKHQKRKPQLWSKRAKLLYSSVNRMTWDGVSSAKYKLLNVTERRFYTHLLIDVGEPPVGFN